MGRKESNQTINAKFILYDWLLAETFTCAYTFYFILIGNEDPDQLIGVLWQQQGQGMICGIGGNFVSTTLLENELSEYN